METWLEIYAEIIVNFSKYTEKHIHFILIPDMSMLDCRGYLRMPKVSRSSLPDSFPKQVIYQAALVRKAVGFAVVHCDSQSFSRGQFFRGLLKILLQRFLPHCCRRPCLVLEQVISHLHPILILVGLFVNIGFGQLPDSIINFLHKPELSPANLLDADQIRLFLWSYPY